MTLFDHAYVENTAPPPFLTEPDEVLVACYALEDSNTRLNDQEEQCLLARGFDRAERGRGIDAYMAETILFFGCLCSREDAIRAALEAHNAAALQLACSEHAPCIDPLGLDAHPDARRSKIEVLAKLRDAISWAKERATGRLI